MISKSEPIVITNTVSKSGNGYVLRIPKSIVDLMKIDESAVIEASIRKIEKSRA
jgi:antitoxin component of MazEF toxin-antitoxin module